MLIALLVKLITFGASLFVTVYLLECQLFSNLLTSLGLSLTITIFAWQLASLFRKNLLRTLLSDVDSTNKAILVTGCDTGFGHLTALKLNEYGFKVFAGCLKSDGDGAKQLLASARFKNKLIILGLDVTKDEDIDDAFNKVKTQLKEKEQLWGLVNNAGLGTSAFVEWSTFEYNFKRLFDVNVFGMVKVTRKFLPLIRDSNGRIVNIASLAGRLTTPGLASYAMTKHAVVAFSDSLRREMYNFGVHVSSIEPAFYGTPMVTGVSDGVNQIWDTTTEDVKKAYSVDFFKNFSSKIRTKLSLITSKRFDDVPNTIVQSLTTRIPESRYVVTEPWQRPIFTILQLAPNEFLDVVSLANKK